jgi:membrane fusion protein, multidrug efflux system
MSKDGWVAPDTLDQTTSNFRQSVATLAADAAAIQTAELKLGYTEIRAPFVGRLGKSLVHEGATINAAGAIRYTRLARSDFTQLLIRIKWNSLLS